MKITFTLIKAQDFRERTKWATRKSELYCVHYITLLIKKFEDNVANFAMMLRTIDKKSN